MSVLEGRQAWLSLHPRSVAVGKVEPDQTLSSPCLRTALSAAVKLSSLVWQREFSLNLDVGFCLFLWGWVKGKMALEPLN